MPDMMRAPLQTLRGLLAIAMPLPLAAVAQSQSGDAATEISQLQLQLAARSRAVSEDTTPSPAARQAEQASLRRDLHLDTLAPPEVSTSDTK